MVQFKISREKMIFKLYKEQNGYKLKDIGLIRMQHIFYLPDKDQIIVIQNSENISVCDMLKCQLIINTESLCKHLEDELYFYAVYDRLIFRGLKKDPLKVEQLPFYSNQSLPNFFKFNDSLIFGYQSIKSIEWQIYQVYQFKVQIQDVLLFFETDKIIAISTKSIIIYDANFIVIKQFEFYPLLKYLQIDYQEKDFYLQDIIKIEGDQYLITTQDILRFEICIHSDFVEIVQIYSSLAQILSRKIILIDQNIFALVGSSYLKRQYYIEFYGGRRYQNENKKYSLFSSFDIDLRNLSIQNNCQKDYGIRNFRSQGGR